MPAKHPNLTRLFHDYPTTQLGASGMDVGLPDGQMGNSEVGHTNIGAGRVVYQELTRITKSIQDGPFFDNEAFLGAVENCKKNDSALHLFGLLSDGGVHSHIEHIFGLLDLAKKNGLTKVFVHCFMDGRDVPPTSGIDFVKQLQAKLDEIGIGKIATINGRYYAMDRDNRFERLVKAYSAMVYGEGAYFDDPVAAVQASYDAEVTDEFIVPVVTAKDGQIKANDSIHLCKLPSGSRARNHPYLRRSGIHRLRAQERLFPGILCVHDPVRCNHAECTRGIQAAAARQHLWRVYR